MVDLGCVLTFERSQQFTESFANFSVHVPGFLFYGLMLAVDNLNRSILVKQEIFIKVVCKGRRLLFCCMIGVGLELVEELSQVVWLDVLYIRDWRSDVARFILGEFFNVTLNRKFKTVGKCLMNNFIIHQERGDKFIRSVNRRDKSIGSCDGVFEDVQELVHWEMRKSVEGFSFVVLVEEVDPFVESK